ncbi:MAG: hypothetical protein ACTSQ3_06135 [Candidatus Heimdallarchaeota archaeon]
MLRKGLAVAVFLLFIGVAFAPSMNASVVKDELVEFDVKLCGLGKKHTVSLTQQEADEVDLLFDDIEQRLSEVDTRDEAEVIFNEAVVELDKYGLLGGLSVEQVQRLITDRYQNPRVMRLSEKLHNKNEAGSNSNFFCLIAGEATGARVVGLVEMGCSALLYAIFVVYFISEFVFGSPFFLPQLISFVRSLNNFYQNISFPITFGMVALGCRHPLFSPGGPMQNYPAEGWVWTQGLNGDKSWNGTFYGSIRGLRSPFYAYHTDYIGVTGFLGIKLTRDDGKQFFLGSALRVEIDYGD